jgi:hypothetical protein
MNDNHSYHTHRNNSGRVQIEQVPLPVADANITGVNLLDAIDVYGFDPNVTVKQVCRTVNSVSLCEIEGKDAIDGGRLVIGNIPNSNRTEFKKHRTTKFLSKISNLFKKSINAVKDVLPDEFIPDSLDKMFAVIRTTVYKYSGVTPNGRLQMKTDNEAVPDIFKAMEDFYKKNYPDEKVPLQQLQALTEVTYQVGMRNYFEGIADQNKGIFYLTHATVSVNKAGVDEKDAKYLANFPEKPFGVGYMSVCHSWEGELGVSKILELDVITRTVIECNNAIV